VTVWSGTQSPAIAATKAANEREKASTKAVAWDLCDHQRVHDEDEVVMSQRGSHLGCGAWPARRSRSAWARHTRGRQGGGPMVTAVHNDIFRESVHQRVRDLTHGRSGAGVRAPSVAATLPNTCSIPRTSFQNPVTLKIAK
jgi:hypothetical protein